MQFSVGLLLLGSSWRLHQCDPPEEKKLTAAFALGVVLLAGSTLLGMIWAGAFVAAVGWFFGRKKQVIVHDGSNISPMEVESALDEHPAVALAGVIGIHDEVHGENVRAYVTLRYDHGVSLIDTETLQ